MAVTPTQAPATAAGPEIKDPTLTQQLMLDAPFGDDLCVISARGTGKSWGIVMLVARDAAHWKERYSCLITRTNYQGLTELQGLLWRYLTVAFPGTTYSGGDMTFRVGGKDMLFGYGCEPPEALADWTGNTELTTLDADAFLEVIEELETALVEMGRWAFAEEYCDPREVKRALAEKDAS